MSPLLSVSKKHSYNHVRIFYSGKKWFDQYKALVLLPWGIHRTKNKWATVQQHMCSRYLNKTLTAQRQNQEFVSCMKVRMIFNLRELWSLLLRRQQIFLLCIHETYFVLCTVLWCWWFIKNEFVSKGKTISVALIKISVILVEDMRSMQSMKALQSTGSSMCDKVHLQSRSGKKVPLT